MAATSPRRVLFEAICLHLIMSLLVSNTTAGVGYNKQHACSSDYIEDRPRPMISVSFTPEAAALVQSLELEKK
jgi:hypothetical protein